MFCISKIEIFKCWGFIHLFYNTFIKFYLLFLWCYIWLCHVIFFLDSLSLTHTCTCARTRTHTHTHTFLIKWDQLIVVFFNYKLNVLYAFVHILYSSFKIIFPIPIVVHVMCTFCTHMYISLYIIFTSSTHIMKWLILYTNIYINLYNKVHLHLNKINYHFDSYKNYLLFYLLNHFIYLWIYSLKKFHYKKKSLVNKIKTLLVHSITSKDVYMEGQRCTKHTKIFMSV